VLVQNLIVEEYQEPLAFNVDGEPNVFVDGLRRCEELLTEDVEQAIAANESNEVEKDPYGLCGVMSSF
jgi:hypothetical protein